MTLCVGCLLWNVETLKAAKQDVEVQHGDVIGRSLAPMYSRNVFVRPCASYTTLLYMHLRFTSSSIFQNPELRMAACIQPNARD